MSSNFREHKDYNEQIQICRCRRCKKFGIRFAHGEFCSFECARAHLEKLHIELNEAFKRGVK